MDTTSRRYFITSMGAGCAGLLAGGCRTAAAGEDVSAVEDLMREHGVLRRALLVYRETAPKLRENPSPAIAEALQKTARLFRSFGEDYHEKQLEEAHILPVLKKGDAGLAALASTLVEQHARGRQITDYILSVTRRGIIEKDRGVEAARILESFVVMYQNHAAKEDTVIFPAWKRALSPKQLDELGDVFEDIEHEQFGEDGFESAVRQITEIEASLGLSDLGQFTAEPPPRVG